MASISISSLSSALVPSASLLRQDRRTVILRASSPASAMPAEAKPRPWWAPLFHTIIQFPDGSGVSGAAESAPEPEGKAGRAGRAALTAEKARVLRRRLRGTESWHDAMYHSAIASRLASPDQH